MEEFKNCVPSDIKTYLEEQKIDSLHWAATCADDYALTHKPFGKPPLCTDPFNGSVINSNGNNPRTVNQTSQGNGWGSSHGNGRGASLPAGPTCYYCRRKSHLMSECGALQKNTEKLKSDPLVSQLDKLNGSAAERSIVSEEYWPFIPHGCVLFLDALSRKLVTTLRDTGALQSLILNGILRFSSQSATSMTMLLHGMELGAFQVPFHKICLWSPLLDGSVVVGVQYSLPVQGIDFILGNDLAGGKVMADPLVSCVPCRETMIITSDSDLFPACAVTRAMSRAASEQLSKATMMDSPEKVVNSVLDSDAPAIEVPSSAKESSSLVVDNNELISQESLIKEQKRDKEIWQLASYAVDEQEVSIVPGCFFQTEWCAHEKMDTSRSPSITWVEGNL